MDRHLGLAGATTLVVGQVIAVGIFLTPGTIIRTLASPLGAGCTLPNVDSGVRQDHRLRGGDGAGVLVMLPDQPGGTAAVTVPGQLPPSDVLPRTARVGGLRRRPTGAPPPLPRKLGWSGKLWLALAVLLDATLVRSVLLPATMVVLERWNWYLPAALRWLPEVHRTRPPALALGGSV